MQLNHAYFTEFDGLACRRSFSSAWMMGWREYPNSISLQSLSLSMHLILTSGPFKLLSVFIIICHFKIMLSQSTINQLLDYDIIFVGNIGAVTASSFARKHPNKFKIAVMHLEQEISEPSLIPLSCSQIKVKGRPEVELIHQRIVKMRPELKVLQVEGGKRLGYKVLVYGEAGWLRISPQHPFSDALSSQYSLIGSNMSYGDRCTRVRDGNFVFFVEDKPNSFSQCYPFLYYYYKMNQPKVNFIILLQGDNFYTHCPFAHQLLEQHLKTHKFKIITGVKVKRVDYLRRVIHYSVEQGSVQTIQYEGAYCLLGQTPPDILRKSGIQYRNCHPRYIYNKQYPTIYVLGADATPTTHSFTALSHQIKTLIQNLPLQLYHQEHPSQTLKLVPYQGHTRIKIMISDKETVTLKHNYTPHQYQIQKGCGCFTSLYYQHIQPHLIKQFYNFGAFGIGCFLWTLQTNVPQEVTSEVSEEKELELEGNNNVFQMSESQPSYYH